MEKILNGLTINYPDFINASFSLIWIISHSTAKRHPRCAESVLRRREAMPMLEKYRHYFDIDPDYFPKPK